MMVKVCGITNAEDALAAVEEGVSALGFVFYPRSPRYVKPEDARTIIARVPAHVWKVGVFVNETPAGIARLAAECGLDVAQLHGDETPAEVPEGLRVWKALRVNAAFDASRLDGFDVEAFLLDAAAGAYGGSGQTFDWSRVRGLDHRIIVAGGLDAANVGEAIRQARPWGVDTSSRLESSPGKKDHAKLRAFVRAARLEMET